MHEVESAEHTPERCGFVREESANSLAAPANVAPVDASQESRDTTRLPKRSLRPPDDAAKLKDFKQDPGFRPFVVFTATFFKSTAAAAKPVAEPPK